ncbi:MAG: tetratricopeptide repeat protein [Alphaproteobacteria bacterium]|nr:tetratricopeptide repeat protein [Alphaproteobacteria bacterium]
MVFTSKYKSFFIGTCALALIFLFVSGTKAQDTNSDDFDTMPGSEGNTISGPTAYVDSEEKETKYYDAEMATPGGEMSKQGPIGANPESRPAAPFVVVRKDYNADTQSAQLVAADRAVGLGRYDSALKIYEIIEEKTPNDGRVLMGKAVSLQKLGRFDEAMKTYEKLAEIDSKNLDVKQNMLGLLATRYPSVALRRLMELHNENSDNVGIVAQLAFAFARTGDSRSAMEYLGIASSMEPHNASHIYNMAVIYDQAGETVNAVKLYEQALETDTLYGGGRSIPRDAVFERLAQIR